MISQAYKILNSRQKWHFVLIVLVLILTGVSTAITLAGFAPILGFLATGEFDIISSPVNNIYQIVFTENSLSSYIFFVGAFLITSTSLQLVRIWSITKFGIFLTHNFSSLLIKNILATNYLDYGKLSSSEYAGIILQETLEVANKFYRPMLELIGSSMLILIVLFTSIYLFFENIFINLIPPFLIISSLVLISIKINKKHGRIKSEALSSKYETAMDTLNGYTEINITQTRDYFTSRYMFSSLKFSAAAMIVDILAMLPQVIIQALIYCIILFVAWSSFFNGHSQDELTFEITNGAMIALVFLRLAPEITKISANLGLISSSRRPLQRMYENLSKFRNIGKKSSINFQDINCIKISSLYDKPHPNSDFRLKLDEFEMKVGDRIGVIGRSGSGKTTFLKIIMGLIPTPQSAEVKINGDIVKNINSSNLRNHIAVVSQDIFLFSATIYENIAFGVAYENINKERVVKICQLVELHEVIAQNFINGYDTKISQDHSKLSGGQRQRLGVARALYRNSQILLLDEPSSALDKVSEQKLKSALNSLPRSVTMLIITHRLELLELCNKIVEFENGYGSQRSYDYREGDQS